MTKEMTPSIGENQIKSKLNIIFAHHTGGKKCTKCT
jgi:hypothetical protein